MPFRSAIERRSRTTYRPTVTPEGSTHVDTAFTGTTSSFSRTASGNIAVAAVVPPTGFRGGAVAGRHGAGFVALGRHHRLRIVNDDAKEPRPGEHVHEPACGSGGLLRAAAQGMRERGLDPASVHWSGVDIDQIAAACTAVNAIVWGARSPCDRCLCQHPRPP
ncbi:N-6 DNA methylase [Streptomyces abikoensis]|uniref:N-6 DNA methylase n=1 Tax=Streptomyces abikoensis TaxID=97398 RepID=UPI00357161B5